MSPKLQVARYKFLVACERSKGAIADYERARADFREALREEKICGGDAEAILRLTNFGYRIEIVSP